jgi:hypothetical protein
VTSLDRADGVVIEDLCVVLGLRMFLTATSSGVGFEAMPALLRFPGPCRHIEHLQLSLLLLVLYQQSPVERPTDRRLGSNEAFDSYHGMI